MPFLENVTAQASILTLMAIAVERYYVIWRPLEVSYTCTTGRTICVCAIVWLLASVCSIPPVLMVVYLPCLDNGDEVVHTCGSFSTGNLGNTYVISTTVVFFFLPCVFLTVVYCMFANTLRRHDEYMNQIKNKERSMNGCGDKPLELGTVRGKTLGFKKKYMKCATSIPAGEEQQAERDKLCGQETSTPSKKTTSSNHGDAFTAASRQTHRRVIYMLGSVVIVFFVCWLPMRVMILWQIFATDEQYYALDFNRIMIMITCFRIMLYINSSINPLLYNLISTKFRGAFRDALSCDRNSWNGRKRRCRSSMRSYTSNTSFRNTAKTDFNHA